MGYVALALVRAAGDRVLGDAPAWRAVLEANRILLDVLMATVSAGIGLHLSIRAIARSSTRALVVSGGTSIYMAALTLAMITAAARGAYTAGAAIGLASLGIGWLAHRTVCSNRAEQRRLRARFDGDAPLTLAEAITLLEDAEATRALDEKLLRRVLVQLSPAVGELIPARTTPLAHGEGCRWMTYWEGRTGWALVAIVREPGSTTPIHAHPHRLLGKTIEGSLEELRFREIDADSPRKIPGEIAVELVSRELVAHNVLFETDGLRTLHVVRAVGAGPSIDLQLRGPEEGAPGRRLRVSAAVNLRELLPGARVLGVEEVDDRPGHGGEGAAAGRWAGPEQH